MQDSAVMTVIIMGYRYREDLTAADVAFEADGRTLEELFESAAIALTNTMIEDSSILADKVERKITIHAAGEERLLHDFLDELVFLKDAEMLIFRSFSIKITKSKSGDSPKFSLEATLKGEEIDTARHRMVVDVKAVSWHHFELKKGKDGWKALVIVDV